MTAATSPESTAITIYTATLAGLEPSTIASLRAQFDQFFADAETWIARASAIKVTDVGQVREMKIARESRLALRAIRVQAEHARKGAKEEALKKGKTIDAVANIIRSTIEPIETYLLEQETFAERAEEARKLALKSAREEALRALGVDPIAYADLGETSEEVWTLTLRSAQEAKTAREEAARQEALVRVEAERIAAEKKEAARQEAARLEAERVERERQVAADNERLRAEAAVKERERAAERAVAEEEARAAREAQTLRDEAHAKERAALEAAVTAEREKAAEADRARVEREEAAERDKAARDADERLKVELKARADEEAAVAPDKVKLVAFARMLRELRPLPLASERGKKAGVKIDEQLVKLASWVESCAGKL